MKSKSLLLMLVVVFSIFTIKQNGYSQSTIYGANTPDQIASSGSINVENTGIFAVRYNFTNCHVSVWDGESPGFSWTVGNTLDYTSAFNGGENVVDPDVAVYIESSDIYAFFVYILDNNVYYEIWKYRNASWSNYVQSTQVSTENNSSNPNIDVNDLNAVAIVWEQGSDIKIWAGDIQGNMSPYINSIDGTDYRNPDVAVGKDSSNASYVNVVFVNYESAKTLHKNSFTFQDLLTQDDAQSLADFGYRVYRNDDFGKPRIASPVQGVRGSDCEVVVEHYMDSINKHCIKGLHYRNNYFYGPTIISDSLTGLNKEPVVAYSNNSDSIVVCWTHHDTIGTYGNPYDIIQRRLEYVNGIPAFSYFSAVNSNLSNIQEHSSVCGRYLSYGSISYLFYDENTDTCFSKTSLFNNQYIRLGKIKPTNSIYPNPAKDKLFIGNILPESTANVKIFDSNKRLVKQIDNVVNNNSIDISELMDGIYIIEIINNETITVERVIVI